MQYLIKERVISSSYSSPVRLSTNIHFHHWLDVVARQLSPLDNPNTNLDIPSNCFFFWNTTYYLNMISSLLFSAGICSDAF